MGALERHFSFNIKDAVTEPRRVYIGNSYRISILSDVLIRFEYNEKGIFNDYPTLFAINRNFGNSPSVKVQEDDTFLNITGQYFTIEYIKERPFIANKITPDSNLRVTLNGTTRTWFVNNPEVRNYGGSTYSLDDSKGNVTFNRGLYSIDGFASFNDSKKPIYDMDGSIKKNPSEGLDIYLFIYGNHFDEALKSYFNLTGFPMLIPRYALGIWWNKNEKYSDEDIININEEFNRHEMPLSVVLLNNWSKADVVNKKIVSNGYQLNEEYFPNIKEFKEQLISKKLFLGTKLDLEHGVAPSEPSYNEMKKDMILKETENVPINVYSDIVMSRFLKNVINPLDNLGIDFYLIDDKTTDYTRLFLHNYYLFKDKERNDKIRGIVMSKNPGIASHRYSILYSGETLVSWKTLRMLPYFNSTNANIGLSWWSHDIGGYKQGTEDNELYTRYVQLGVYSPIFRFSSKEGKFYKREPWLWDVKTQKIVRDYVRVRYKLIPYIYSEAYKYHKNGTPLTRPLYYEYPEIYDEPIYRNEYHFGSELFVSPITESKDTIMNRVIQKIYLPEGTWYDFKTGKKFNGNKRYVTFYKDEDYPVYAKSGSIIPMAILDENDLNNTNVPNKMEIHIFPGKNNTYNLYEDDGISQFYKNNFYLLSTIDYNYRENNYTVIIRPVEGKNGIITKTRDYKIRFRNTKFAEDVKINVDRTEVKYKSYIDGTDFIVEVENVPTANQLTINCAGKDIEIDAVRLINEEIDEIVSELKIKTELKEKIDAIIYSDKDTSKKRIAIRKLKKDGLNPLFIKMFIKLLEYIEEI